VSKNIFSFIKEFIDNFEENILNDKQIKEQSGVVYTPQKVADYMVNNIFNVFFNDYCRQSGQEISPPDRLDLDNLKGFLNSDVKEQLKKRIEGIKILDPACGTGRFLIAIANYLLKLIRLIDEEQEEFEIRKKILQNNIYGIEIDSPAYNISRLRLISWLYSNNPSSMTHHENKLKNLEINNIKQILDDIQIEFNISNVDFLFEFGLDEEVHFDFIIGNPPYIENKKIKDIELKKRIYKSFKSAYKLFDLSIIFLEKSLDLMKNNGESYLSFIVPNKFCSADYGVKIRELLLSQTEIKEIHNISSLNIFENAATYPIIISIKKSATNGENEVLIKNYEDLNELLESKNKKLDKIPQNVIQRLPSQVIPISGDIKIIQYLYSKYQTISETFSDVKITYRPFGFLNWAKYFKNINEKKASDKDLILLGTGNVEKYYIKFNKMIRIAKQDLKVSYFRYNPKYKEIWRDLSNEKILIREIAKGLTCAYDPGVFANITGLYILEIPSLNTQKLFSFLTVMNSNLMNLAFKTLFGTLHMSGGYMRFNGSFIRRLPMPKEFPKSLNNLGRINQFLSQLDYDYSSMLIDDKELNITEIRKYSNFFIELANDLVELLFLEDYDNYSNENSSSLKKLLHSNVKLPELQVKFNNPNFNLPKFEIYKNAERIEHLNAISALYKSLK